MIVPHSAFIDEELLGEASRESIEVRALVFHRDDTDCALATMVYQYSRVRN
jgi:hypothetical protein